MGFNPRVILSGFIALFSIQALAAPLADQPPTLPSNDAFYNVPANADKLPPGGIISHRPPPAPIRAFRTLPFNLKEAHQFLYRTTDSHGNATATVLTVFVPYFADYSKVLSYQNAEDAAYLNCAPSYVYQKDSVDAGTQTTQLEILLIEAALEQNWVVIVPDHEGYKGAFTANRAGGHAVLDGIRAALSSGSITGIKPNARVAMWGYSGGSLVSGWAAELQPTYAPELKIVGVAAGGNVPDIMSAVRTVNGGPNAGLLPAGILGMGKEFPELAAEVEKHIKPENRDHLHKALSQCLGANGDTFGNQDILGMFDDPNILDNPILKSTVAANDLGHTGTPKIPLYIYKAVKDEISPVADTDALVQRYCSTGGSVTYVRDGSANHGSLAVIGAFKALAWLHGVMDGHVPPKSCSTVTLPSTLLDLVSTLEFLPLTLVNALLDIIGKPIGVLK
ncbi:hypothetical protein VHEMI01351 [[Torrubiella] hemipterigena]|uniref:Uncharacterized protein n=1 Tax=[Torrubiella] hemipterigena TaxID=1531966 RepID=A0A0A1T7A2_9HYPO|nr:hypothetical protein VHEMI01351 [[Torrubiella] hemipterigena]